MIPLVEVLKNYNLDDTTKSIWGISRSYDNVFLDSDVIGVVDLDDENTIQDSDLLWQAADYIGVIHKMLDEWERIKVVRPSMDAIETYRDALRQKVGELHDEGADGDPMKALQDFDAAVQNVTATLSGRVLILDGDEPQNSLYEHLRDLLLLFDEKIGIVKSGELERDRMLHQVSLMYVLTLTRRGECSVLASDQGYEGLITIPFRNLLSREVDDPDSPLNVLRGSRVTAILPDDNGKFRRNFVSSWVSPNDRVFVTVGGVEDVEAREEVLGLIRGIASDLNRLGYSGEKYRLDISADRDTLEDMFDDLINRVPKPVDGRSSVGIETMIPLWERLGEICGVLGFHAMRDESLRHLGSIRGRRFAIEIDRLKAQMDQISNDPDWYSNPDKLEQFQTAQKDMMALIDRRRRR